MPKNTIDNFETTPALKTEITDPLIIMFEQEGKTICHIHPAEGHDYRTYSILLCDLARHIARAFKVEEEEVWEWIDRERDNPTTEIIEPS